MARPAASVEDRPNRFEVDLGALASNSAAMRRLVGTDTRIYAALKADAYGFGLLPVAETLLESGTDCLSMVSLRDALAVRSRSLNCPLLLYAGVTPSSESVRAMEENHLTATVTDWAMAQELNHHASGLDVFVKVDTGLERLGVAAERVLELITKMRHLRHLRLAGIYAHMHASEGTVPPYLQWQFDRFNGALAQLAAAGLGPPVRMVASTPVIAHTMEMNLNAVDPGRAFLGFEHWGVLSELGLRPVLHRITSRLIQVRELQREAFLEFAPYEVKPGMRLGLLPMGIYDGLDRLHAGEVLVRGRRAAVLAVSIEHCRIDLSAVPDAQMGDEVVVVGNQGDDEITCAEVAAAHGFRESMIGLHARDSLLRYHLTSSSLH